MSTCEFAPSRALGLTCDVAFARGSTCEEFALEFGLAPDLEIMSEVESTSEVNFTPEVF